MEFSNLKKTANQTLSIKSMCEEVEVHYQSQIRRAGSNIVSYLQKNQQIESLHPAVSELVHIIFYKLRYEIRQCFLKEKRTLFPLITGGAAMDDTRLADVIEPARKTHKHILELAQRLRQIMGQYEVQSHYSVTLKEFINELRIFENNICKWIIVEEDLLFPKVTSDIARAKFITTVF